MVVLQTITRKRSDKIYKIVYLVSRHFLKNTEEILSRKRDNSIIIPRQIIMYILWQSQEFTLREIGDVLHRTPATVSWGYKRTYERMNINDKLKELVTSIEKHS